MEEFRTHVTENMAKQFADIQDRHRSSGLLYKELKVCYYNEDSQGV